MQLAKRLEMWYIVDGFMDRKWYTVGGNMDSSLGMQ